MKRGMYLDNSEFKGRPCERKSENYFADWM